MAKDKLEELHNQQLEELEHQIRKKDLMIDKLKIELQQAENVQTRLKGNLQNFEDEVKELQEENKALKDKSNFERVQKLDEQKKSTDLRDHIFLTEKQITELQDSNFELI